MITLLKEEQEKDAQKKAFCESELDKTEDKTKELTVSIRDISANLGDAKETVNSAQEEITALKAGIAQLDTQVEAATAQRKLENAEFTEAMAESTAAADLIDMAKNRLNKFYNPKLYVAPPPTAMGGQQSVAVAFGTEAAPAATPVALLSDALS